MKTKILVGALVFLFLVIVNAFFMFKVGFERKFRPLVALVLLILLGVFVFFLRFFVSHLNI
jgi:energy-coupling factor transporter transmembrane protein EcfT